MRVGGGDAVGDFVGDVECVGDVDMVREGVSVRLCVCESLVVLDSVRVRVTVYVPREGDGDRDDVCECERVPVRVYERVWDDVRVGEGGGEGVAVCV